MKRKAVYLKWIRSCELFIEQQTRQRTRPDQPRGTRNETHKSSCCSTWKRRLSIVLLFVAGKDFLFVLFILSFHFIHPSFQSIHPYQETEKYNYYNLEGIFLRDRRRRHWLGEEGWDGMVYYGKEGRKTWQSVFEKIIIENLLCFVFSCVIYLIRINIKLIVRLRPGQVGFLFVSGSVKGMRKNVQRISFAKKRSEAWYFAFKKENCWVI